MIKTMLKAVGIYKLYEKWLENMINKGEMPSHIAIIMDGNRRWALEKGLEPWLGHRAGADKLEEVIEWCLKFGIKVVTFFVLSTENFKRPSKELSELFNLLKEKAAKYLKSDILHKHRIRVKIIGRKQLLPPDVRTELERLEEETKDYDRLFVNLAIAYGGRAELTDAAKKLAHDVVSGKLRIDQINEEVVGKYLYTADLPIQDPDMIIRTSGEERISNFLLWQSAYSELVFLDVYWPEFRKIDFMRAIRTYQVRARRFGA
ncbi:MAG: polyprenyl diphosphate synthase [Aigarchaeota archaeon]|nr:polyprenyl diphosphate synthase [Aigarchaeota archaeon]MDW8021798.1 polyprenyl diphosphate synthase [Nitrososphaerota archaeon]